MPVGVFGTYLELPGSLHGGGHVDVGHIHVPQPLPFHTDRIVYQEIGSGDVVWSGARERSGGGKGYLHEPEAVARWRLL